MSQDDGYLTLLRKARESLPDVGKAHERLVIPEADLLIEGSSTVWRNFLETVKVINREPDDVLTYVQRELGTAGVIEGQRVHFKGKITKHSVDEKVKAYIADFVICAECGKPDTHLEKEGRILRIKCEACGAFHPVRVKKGAKTQESDSLKEGDIVEVSITELGKKGDGVARMGGVILYVPGSIKGETVKVKIDKVRGTMAFGHPVRE